jgi:hypothetical protein
MDLSRISVVLGDATPADLATIPGVTCVRLTVLIDVEGDDEADMESVKERLAANGLVNARVISSARMVVGDVTEADLPRVHATKGVIRILPNRRHR